MKKDDKKTVSKEQLKRVQECVGMAGKALKQNAEGAEAVLVTHHIVKNGVITSYFDYSDFPTGDWGIVLEAIAVEARQARLKAQTARSER